MTFERGDVRVFQGVTYTFNGDSWTYTIRKHPKSVATILTFAGTPPAPEESEVRTADETDLVDYSILAGLATGRLFANEVQVSS